MIEFILAGIASATLMISTVQISLAMWNYHTLAYAVHETNRYIIVHGRACSQGTNNCTITVANIVSKFQSNSIGLDASKVTLTLTPQTSTAKSCSPITACSNSSDQWPPSTNLDNYIGRYSTVKASYTTGLGIVSLWFRSKGTRIGTATFTSQSKLAILH
jgi:hypothetical protein